jgi:hypothetical protein
MSSPILFLANFLSDVPRRAPSRHGVSGALDGGHHFDRVTTTCGPLRHQVVPAVNNCQRGSRRLVLPVSHLRYLIETIRSVSHIDNVWDIVTSGIQ